MSSTALILLVVIATVIAFNVASMRARTLAKTQRSALHSLPSYYGHYAALWGLLPALAIIFSWLLFQDSIVTGLTVNNLPAELASLPVSERDLLVNDIKNVASGSSAMSADSLAVNVAADAFNHYQKRGQNISAVLTLSLFVLGLFWSWRKIRPDFKARNQVEKVVQIGLIVASSVAILTTLGIVLSVLFESIRFFQLVPMNDFLFGTNWSPGTAIRSDQVGSSGSFGAIPLFTGTLLISTIALVVAVPLGLMTAIYLSEYADHRFRSVAKPALEVLAGIPTVVYGFFAALTVGPLLRSAGDSLGISVASESALGAGLVMGVMIIPFVSSLSDDVINAVPQAMRDGSLGLGATQSETIKKVVIPAALPGIVGGILLAASRAIGETMIVVMAAGLAANLTANPFEAVTTVTVQIVTLLVGDQEFDSAKTLAAFALGLMLFVVTLILNVIALFVVRRYREQYE